MNMLISQCAERGERASPVLFLHSSDERGMEKRERKTERERNWESVCCCWRGKGISEGQRRKTLEGENVEIHL